MMNDEWQLGQIQEKRIVNPHALNMINHEWQLGQINST